MSITRKTVIFTGLTTLLIGTLIISYFIWMLPGLYVRYKSDNYLHTVEEVHRRFMEGKTFDDGYQLSDLFYLVSLKLPKEDETIQVSSPNFSMDVVLEAPELKQLYRDIRKVFQQFDEEEIDERMDFNDVDFEPIRKLFQKTFQPINQEIYQIENFQGYPFEVIEGVGSREFRMTADDILITGETAEQNANHYTNYFVFKEVDETIYVTMASTMTPKLNELLPIVTQSIPMILSVLVLSSFLIAKWFSRKLAQPIEMLANQAMTREKTTTQVFNQPNKGDEFEILENALNQMHEELQENLSQLHDQNQQLERMHLKQGLLLANASHQLKTPIAASSLLLEGMIHQVGKFKDTDKYLPEVRKEIKKMQSIIDRLMMVFEEQQQVAQIQRIDIDHLIQRILLNYQCKISERQLTQEKQLTSIVIETDGEMFTSILENLIQNAVKYTPKGKGISIELTKNQFTLISQGAKIDQHLLAHIREPFVRDTKEEEAGTGLGLYLVDMFAEILGMRWNICNTESGVQVTVEWRSEQ